MLMECTNVCTYVQVEKRPCPKCGNELEPNQKFICGPCNSKRATLSKMFGKWPIPIFGELSPEVQQEFWAGPQRTKDALTKMLEIHISRTRIEVEARKVVGQFLPISVWAVRGFNTTNIEKNCERKWDDALEEWTYCLNIIEVVEEKIKKEVACVIASSKDTGSLRGKLSHYCSPSAKKRKR